MNVVCPTCGKENEVEQAETPSSKVDWNDASPLVAATCSKCGGVLPAFVQAPTEPAPAEEAPTEEAPTEEAPPEEAQDTQSPRDELVDSSGDLEVDSALSSAFDAPAEEADAKPEAAAEAGWDQQFPEAAVLQSSSLPPKVEPDASEPGGSEPEVDPADAAEAAAEQFEDLQATVSERPKARTASVETSDHADASFLASSDSLAVHSDLEEELADLRTELEDEVGSIFADDPSRQHQPSTFRIGEKEAKPAAPTESNPSIPAYKVVEVSGLQDFEEDDDTIVDMEDDTIVDDGGPLKMNPLSQREAVEWRPGASELASLVEEEFAASRPDSKDPVDDMLKPPEIKPKKEPEEPAPPPAFDRDLSAQEVSTPDYDSPELQQAPLPVAPQPDVLLAENSGSVVVVKRSNTALIVLVVFGATALVLLTAIVVILVRSQQYSTNQALVTGPNAPPIANPLGTTNPTGNNKVAPPITVAAVDAGARPDHRRPDIAPPAKAPAPKPDAAVVAVAVAQPPPKQVEREKPKREIRAPGKKSIFESNNFATKKKQKAKARAEREKAKRDREQETEKRARPKKNRFSGKRPAGCDPVLFPDPLDCPKSGPPGKSQILEVVRKNLRQVDNCAKKQHAIDPDLATGTIVIRFWIKPTGHTTKVQVVTDRFKGSAVGRCIVAKVDKWHFGAWEGRRIGPINFPFKLKTR